MNTLPGAADVVIIGGGITGVSTAWELARQGAGKVVVLERHIVAAGPSGRTGALLRRHYSNFPEATLAHAGQQTYANWHEIVDGECGFVPAGIVITVATGEGLEANRAKMQRNVALQQSIGVNTSVISPAELIAMQPFVVCDDSTGIAYEPDSGYVDSVLATRSMAQAAIRAGVTVCEGVSVLKIGPRRSGAFQIDTSVGSIATSAIVVAAGPWSPAVLESTGLDLPVTPIRVQIAIVHRPMQLESPHLVFIDTAAGMFCRPWAPGRTLIGVGVGETHEAVDPDRYDERCDSGYPAQATAAVARRIPAMAHASLVYGTSCLYDMSPDAHPIIGSTPIEGLFVAAGFSGAGFKKAPAVAKCLAETILFDRSTLVDLTPFNLNRFDTSAWRHPWSDTEYEFTSDFGHKL